MTWAVRSSEPTLTRELLEALAVRGGAHLDDGSDRALVGALEQPRGHKRGVGRDLAEHLVETIQGNALVAVKRRGLPGVWTSGLPDARGERLLDAGLW